MKKIVLAAAISLAAINVHAADVGAFFGVTYAYDSNKSDGGLGLTLQATTTRKENRGIGAAGVSFYPFSKDLKFGIPVGVGYQGDNAAAIISYDLLQKKPAVSGGYVDTREPQQAPAPVVVPLT